MVILMKNMSEENLFSKLEKILTKEKEYVFDFSDANFSDNLHSYGMSEHFGIEVYLIRNLE